MNIKISELKTIKGTICHILNGIDYPITRDFWMKEMPDGRMQLNYKDGCWATYSKDTVITVAFNHSN